MGKTIILGEKGMVFNIIQFLQFSLFAIWGDNGKRRIVGCFEGIHTNQAVHSTAAPDKLSTTSIKNIVRKRARSHLGQTNYKFWIFFVVSKFWFYPKQIESEQHDSLVGEVETCAQNKEEGEIHAQMTWDGFACNFGWETICLQCFIGWSITSIGMN